MFAYLLFAFTFYITFYNIESEKLCFLINGAVLVLYMVFCDYWMYGNWWINSAPLFMIGMLVAKKESSVVKVLKKLYIPLLIITIAIAGFGLWFGDYTTISIIGATTLKQYSLYRILRLFAQICAAVAFLFAILLIGLKLKIGNKILDFMGSITLDFYLIQGIFVQIFSYCIMAEACDPLIYIKNPLLYVLLVLACSIGLAVLLKFANKKSLQWFEKHDVIYTITSGIAVFFRFFVIGVVILTAYWCIISHVKSSNMKEQVTAYSDAHLQYVDVDGKKMAAYVAGEGEHTIVVMHGLGTPCPTFAYRELADVLGQENRIVVVDSLGYGFSDDTDLPRTNENIATELHAALGKLGITGPYILMPNDIAGIYAVTYVEMFPDEVEAIIGIDASVPGYFEDEMERYHVRTEEMHRDLAKRIVFARRSQTLLNLTGYARLKNPILTDLMSAYRTEEELDVFEEIIINKSNSKALEDEVKRQWDNYESVYGKKLPDTLPALFILDKGSDEQRLYYGTNWRELYEAAFSNTDIQSYNIINASPYMMYTSPSDLKLKVGYYIRDELNGVLANN